VVYHFLPDNERIVVEYGKLDYSVNDYDITRGLHIDKILYMKNYRVPFLLLINTQTFLCSHKFLNAT